MRRLTSVASALGIGVQFAPRRFKASTTADHHPPGREGSAIVTDDTDEWLDRHVERSVQAGRLTDEAAAYFSELRKAKPDLRRFTQEARNLIGDQPPDKLTRYQQSRLSEKLSVSMSNHVAENLQRSLKEENEMKLYQKEGVPTGQNYWMEAGQVLLDPSVPAWLRDEILAEMKQARPADSPANEVSGAAENSASSPEAPK